MLKEESVCKARSPQTTETRFLLSNFTLQPTRDRALALFFFLSRLARKNIILRRASLFAPGSSSPLSLGTPGLLKPLVGESYNWRELSVVVKSHRARRQQTTL
jgi:hypothetical protein